MYLIDVEAPGYRIDKDTSAKRRTDKDIDGVISANRGSVFLAFSL